MRWRGCNGMKIEAKSRWINLGENLSVLFFWNSDNKKICNRLRIENEDRKKPIPGSVSEGATMVERADEEKTAQTW